MKEKDEMLENIMSSTEEEVKKIIKTAETEIKFQEQVTNNKIKKFKERLENDYKKKINNRKRLIKSQYSVRINKDKLNKREKLITAVFDEIKDKFFNCSYDEYKNFIITSIKNAIDILEDDTVKVIYNKTDQTMFDDDIKKVFEDKVTFESDDNFYLKGAIINSSDNRRYLVSSIENILEKNKSRIRFLIWKHIKEKEPELSAAIE